ncbi:pilin [Burkholderia cenocepacia]|uniref:pilin n=1 Tax=Burkholderia cenocepacia TaxID=95486 RepID=UPI001B8F2F26|nr:pilin [Burkholderia cenocepacia]MBR7905823.1 pilin [Burkholderia cenocepacia]MBR8426613.1 pilin [Burkholderia cenocepacia]
MFDNIMSEINSLSRKDIDLMLSKKATLSDFCINFYNKSAGEFGSKDFYQMMSNKEKTTALGNALAFRVGEVFKLDDAGVRGLMRKIEEDKPLSIADDKNQNVVKSGLKFKGFILIELMVSVGIVGLLSAFAIPAYQAHVAKAQVSEGITLAEGFKSGVSEFYASNGVFPKLSDLGMSEAVGKWVSGTTIDSNGVITATFNSDVVKDLNGKIVSLKPSVQSGGNLAWDCSSNAPQDYLPKSCLTIASGGNSGSGDSDSTQPSQPDTPDTWSSTTGTRWTFPISNRYSDIGTISYQDSIRTLTVNGVNYSLDFMASDGTQVFKTTSASGYDFIALAGPSSSTFGAGSLIYEKAGTNQITVSANKNASGVQTTPQKTIDSSSYPQWLTDYLNSTQFKSGK